MCYLLIPLFLAWGSFLNMVAYRLIHDVSFKKHRSFCPKCNKTLYWYDLIPVVSWLFLNGKCRYCKQQISVLYPAIELLSALSFYLLFLNVPYPYTIPYFIFFSALIVSIRTDIETMLISRYVTLFLTPIALPMGPANAIIGAFFGYFLLFFISKIFFFFTKKEGIGEGDFELLALIGAFTGIAGCWVSLLLGSILGSLLGIMLMLFNKTKISQKIPFGPFLAIGAMLYVLYQNQILHLLFGI